MPMISATLETRHGPVLVFPPPRRWHVRPAWVFVGLLAVHWAALAVAAPAVWRAWSAGL